MRRKNINFVGYFNILNMAKPTLTTEMLIKYADEFCNVENGKGYEEIYGATDGKAIGTFVEHKFQEFLKTRCDFNIGSSANGLDLPSINTDIKVTSIKQPQSRCPYKDSKQKIFGLGYNLIVFAYDKHDDDTTKQGSLKFCSCTYIDSSCTADYQTTTGLTEIIKNNGNSDDIFAFLSDRNIPADEVTLRQIAEQIIKNPPQIGYLTISNALQWRLQYNRVIKLDNTITGITHIKKDVTEQS